jgi:hypothetical protein
MSYLEDGPMTLQEMEAAVALAQTRLDEERARLQRECPHKYADLTFNYSGVSAYGTGKTEHGMTIRCKCGRQFAQYLTIHDDP